ncbi:reverse transcriptase-like protein [Schinkia sp. CFF1]
MIQVYIDGASAGDPGPSGAGIFINNNGVVERYSIPLGVMSNHEAEYAALVKAMEICKENGYKVISVRTDSQAVDRAVEKRYAKKEKFKIWLDQALLLMDQFDLCFLKWVPSSQNSVADELARKAIQLNK